MFSHKLQYRIVLFSMTLIVIILVISGWSLHWVIRQSLEREMGEKLMSVANAASTYFNEEEIRFLLDGPGPRLQSRLRNQLNRLKQATQSKRIYFFNEQRKSLLDTDPGIEGGDNYFHLRFHQKEISSLKNGESSHSVLFQSIDAQPTMTGFAPLLSNNRIVGGVGVQGSATFLKAVKQFYQRLYLIGVIGLVLAFIFSILLTKTITDPINRLVQSSKKIGRGDYQEAIPSLGKSEIGLLAQTMEEMRKNVTGREQELKAMLAGVAHEIRNPLGGIELFTGLLTDEVKENSEAKKHVKRISREIDYLKEIVNNFLDYARPQKPKLEHCQIGDTIHEVQSLCTEDLKQYGIDVEITGDKDQKTIWCDPIHFKRILLNLLRNSIQAIEGGGIIKIHWIKDQNRVSLFVGDSGTGISPKDQENIFKPFFTTREKGTGLGLSIVKSLIDINGGSIRLVKSDQNGTDFEVQFAIN